MNKLEVFSTVIDGGGILRQSFIVNGELQVGTWYKSTGTVEAFGVNRETRKAMVAHFQAIAEKMVAAGVTRLNQL